jgi:hypothetical protein
MYSEIETCLRAITHETLTSLRAPFLSRRFQQAVAAESELVKVNVGAGSVPLRGWINTDVGWRTANYLDLTKPWPLPAGSVDRIYGDNVIEHFPLDVCRTVLRYCWDALSEDGALRLASLGIDGTVSRLITP